MEDCGDLRAISDDYEKDRFSYDIDIYYSYLDKMMSISINSVECLNTYFDVLEDIVSMMRDSGSHKKMSRGARESLFERVKAAWASSIPDQRKASLMAIATMLIPHKGVREWMRAQADKEDPEYAKFMIECASLRRETYIV